MAQQNRTTSTRPQPRTKTTVTTTRQRTVKTKGISGARPFKMPFEQSNIVYILIGIGVVTLGYIIMGMSETMGFLALDVSPIVLLLGYLVVIPMGIMYGARRKKIVTQQVVVDEVTTV